MKPAYIKAILGVFVASLAGYAQTTTTCATAGTDNAFLGGAGPV